MLQTTSLTLLFNLTACVSFHEYRQVDVAVVDAESGSSIPSAEITVCYPHPPAIILNHPEDITAFTDEYGKASLSVADYDAGLLWYAEAPGYLKHRAEVRVRDERVPPEFLDDPSSIGADRATIRLYQEPGLKVTVVVPDGYRGPVGLRIGRTERYLQGEVGERDFVFPISERGDVEITLSPLLDRKAAWSRFTAIYANGKLIPRGYELRGAAAASAVALRKIASVPGGVIFVVGTAADEEALRGVLSTYLGPDHSYSSFDMAAWESIFGRESGG
jgi:hypothetical protein